jgi:hypothetical protein
MASCPQCDGFLEGQSFDKPREYLEFARRLIGLVRQGTFVLAQSTCTLEDLFNPEWPADLVEHNLECNTCGRSFQLFADTYRGHAGWGVSGPQTKLAALQSSATS